MIIASPNYFYSFILLVSGLVSTMIALIAWRRRKVVPEARPVAIFSLAIAFWSLTYSIHWTNFLRPNEFFWLDLTYLGVVAFPTAFLLFTLVYTGRSRWLTKKRLIFLLIQPILTLIFLWTDSRFGLFFANKRHSGDAVIFDGSLWFWFHVIYSYSFVLIGLVLLFSYFIRAPKIYRGQTGMAIIGVLIPLTTNIISIFGINPAPNLDLTPMAFTLTSICFAAAIFRFRFLELVPIALDILFENINDAVIVLDINNQIVNVNPQAKIFLEAIPEDLIGMDLKDIMRYIPEIPEMILNMNEGQGEFFFKSSIHRHLEWQITPLFDRTRKTRGRLVTLRDISIRKKIELDLKTANAQLTQQLAEIKSLQTQLVEQAIRDPLTGLFNRRYLQDILGRELSRSTRENTPICLVLMDVDHFKNINDQYGHEVGDHVLKAIAETLLKNMRKSDVAFRYGGEEFLLVFPDADQKSVYERMGFLMKKIHEEVLRIDSLQIQLTVSCGIAEFPKEGQTADEMLRISDQRMYIAKGSGRDQICYAS